MHTIARCLASSSLIGLLAATLTIAAGGCDADRGVAADAGPDGPKPYRFPQHLEKDVDLLLVIDSSHSMEQEQQALSAGLETLVRSLMTPQLGGELPNLHLGVTTTDLGAGSYKVPSCGTVGGDGGKLLNMARVPGCTPPADATIKSIHGVTNIPMCAAGNGPQCVIDSLRCIAALGTHGCDYAMPLEAAKRALDPKLNLNPGFLRSDALLAVVFITDEDDCSAAKTELFDPQQQGLSDPLGPLTPFRCFEFGVRCDINDRNAPGERKGCVPNYDWLHKIERYVTFFRSLKDDPDRIHLAAIAGPTAPVIVGKSSDGPTLEPSCTSAAGVATPAIRLGAVVQSFGGAVLPICEPQSSAKALAPIADRLRGSLPPQCLPKPLRVWMGGVACHQGVDVCKMPSCSGGATCNKKTGLCELGGKSTSEPCGSTCLDKAECTVAEVFDLTGPDAMKLPIPKCPAKYFRDPSIATDDCDGDCPCWRIVADGRCQPAAGVSPFAIEVMRKGNAPPRWFLEVSCREADFSWSAPEVQDAAVHCTPPPAP